MAAVVGTSAPAHAHGDEGLLEVVESTPDDTGSSVTYRVLLRYVNDGDIVDGATVTAFATQEGETPSAPVAMTGVGQGIYEATIAFPATGNWRVVFEAAELGARVQDTFRVQPPPPTTVAPTTTSPPPTTAVPPEDATLADDETSSSDGPPAFLIVGIVVAGVLMLAAGLALVVRRRRDTDEPT